VKLVEIVEQLGLSVATGKDKLDSVVTGVYVGDLLSDVLANAEEGHLWITLQIHPNIMGVASIKGLSGIVVIGGRSPEEGTLRKAEEEKIPLLKTQMQTFEIAGRLYEMGLRGV
jgi:predicted transcriptional regulator